MNSIAKKPIRIGVITDIHYGNEQISEIKNTRKDLFKCIDYMQQEGVEHLLQMGDILDSPDEFAQERLIAITETIESFQGKVYHIIGNHCLDASLDVIMDQFMLSSPWYSFKIESMRFIVLYGMDITTSSQPLAMSDKQRQGLFQTEEWAQEYTGAMGEQQIKWLAKELNLAGAAREQTIVCGHFPLLRETTDELRGILWNHEEIISLLCKFPNIIAYVSGHFHPGAYHRKCGIHFITIPAFQTRNIPPFFSCGIIEIDNSSLNVVNMNKDILYKLTVTQHD